MTEATVAAAAPVREGVNDELTDHNYDGIQEYDNPTPGWWYSLFILSIIGSVFYVAIYHWSPFFGTLPERHASAVMRAEAAQFSELAAMPTDEAKIVTIMHNENWLAQGAAIFTSSCTLCHKADGSGSVGPNLTDNVYKNCTDLMSMYDVVTHGLPAAGMPAKGGAQLNESEIALVTAYVASLRNTNVPGGKAPEGVAVAPFPTLDADGNLLRAETDAASAADVALFD
ncbi:MAG: cbb3-type cytochrome c oxidase N-terminal domain-containing protein [Planctomycetota bacterium]